MEYHAPINRYPTSLIYWWKCFQYTIFKRFYFFIHESHTEREAETWAEGEAGSLQGTWCRDSIPRTPGSLPEPKADAQWLSHPGVPLKKSVYPVWCSNSKPPDQESQALPTEPVRCPGSKPLLNWILIDECYLISKYCGFPNFLLLISNSVVVRERTLYAFSSFSFIEFYYLP